MKKNTKRILSLLLVLMMVVSLFPSAYAAETEDPFVDEGYGSSWEDWDDQPAEEVAPVEEEPFAEEPVEEPAPVEEPVEEPAPVDEPVEAEDPFIEDKPAVSSPANSFYYVGGNGLRVTVDAPEGAFPVDAEMVVTEVPLEEVQAKIDDSEFAGQTAVVATDISFYDGNGAELQPGVPVSVSISSDQIPAVEDPMVLHIADDGRIDAVGQQVSRKAAMAAASVQSAADEQAETLNVSFQASSFSTFTITWRNGGRTVTVHYVDASGNELTVANSSSVFPTNLNNSSPTPAYLIYDIEGYVYSYTYLNNTSTRITPMLVRGNNQYWRYATDPNAPGNNSTELPANANIYVVYDKVTAPTTGGTPDVGGEETWPDDDDPNNKAVFTKSSTHSGLGYNTVTLRISGKEKEVEEATPADVIVVFDVSRSMLYGMSGSPTYSSTRLENMDHNSRFWIAGNATKAMANTLLNGANTDVRMALVTFGSAVSTVQGFTSNYNTFASAVNNLTVNGYTNWEGALRVANRLDVREDAATFVVFVTDGDPTLRVTRGEFADNANFLVSNNNDYLNYHLFGSGQPSEPVNVQNCYNVSIDEVAEIIGSNKTLYGIGVSTDVARLESLFRDGGTSASNVFLASDAAAVAEAFETITQAITSYLGYGDVQITDGITDLTNTEMEVMQEIDPESFTYYRYGGEGNKYGVDEAHKQEWTTRAADGCGAATYVDGVVQWNMGTGFQLEDGVTYLVTFRAWASQEAFDLVAKLNNGELVYEEGHENSITAEQRAQVDELSPPSDSAPGEYTLKTNTDNVKATYKHTSKTGETVTVVSEQPITATPGQGEIQALVLDSMKLKIVKEFEDDLTAGEDRERFVKLTLLRRAGTLADSDSTEEFVPYSFPHTNITPIFDVDGKTIIDTVSEFVNSAEIYLSAANEPKWTASLYVAPGLMTTDNEVLEAGYDFALAEPSVDYHYELVEEIINPMMVGEETQWIGDGDGNYALTGLNRVKSGIDVKKVVKDVDGNVTTAVDDEFTIKGKLLDADGNPFTWQDGDNVNNSGAYHKFVPNPEGEFTFDGIKYERTVYKGHFASTANIEFTLKAGEFIRFINVPESCTFEFYEDDLPAGYDTDYVVDASTQHKTSPDGSFTPEGDVQPTVSSGKASLAAPGVVGNKQYSVTFTNQMTEPQVFYVYHSSNNMVEKIALTEDDSRLTAEKDSYGTITGYTFNIANEVISGNIYGGYYKAYATEDDGIETADAAVRAITYAEKESDPYTYTYATKAALKCTWGQGSGTAYTGAPENVGAWVKEQAYTDSGLTMSPVADTVYYLKEVPDMYLAPATYVVYDNNAGEFNSDKNATFYPVKQIHLISFTDDKNYKSVGFTVNANPKDLAPTTVPFWGTEITIQKMGTTTDTIDVTNRLYKDHIGAVVLQCADSMMVKDQNAYYREIPYHVTPDGVKVTSIRQMTVIINDLTFNPPEGSNPGWIKPGMTKATVAKKPAFALQ